MGSGMPPNQGQQGNPGGMPQQFAGNPMGAGTPGGHMNPGMMGGMPPGGNPNAHALQHLSPAQQQQLLQQQHLQNQCTFDTPQSLRQHHITNHDFSSCSQQPERHGRDATPTANPATATATIIDGSAGHGWRYASWAKRHANEYAAQPAEPSATAPAATGWQASCMLTRLKPFMVWYRLTFLPDAAPASTGAHGTTIRPSATATRWP